MPRMYEVTVDVEGSRLLLDRLHATEARLGPIVRTGTSVFMPPDRDVEGAASWVIHVDAARGWDACQAGLQELGDRWPELRGLLLDGRRFQVGARPL